MTYLDLNDLARRAHETSVAKGFWSMERVPGEILMLIVTEAAEAMEDVRDARPLDQLFWKSPNGGLATERSEQFPKPVGVPSELADIIIRVLDACGAWNIDIQAAVEAKMRYNATRQHLHGRTR